jgi:hypothetical protein
MQLSPHARRRAVISVVVLGAVASIATSRNYATIEASLELPPVQLSEANPVAIFRLHATGEGRAASTSGHVEILAFSTQAVPAPILLSASSRIDDEPGTGAEVASVGTSVAIDCEAMPCADDVVIRLELRRRVDGTWPAPGEWMVSAELNIQIGDHQEPPRGTKATLERVP